MKWLCLVFIFLLCVNGSISLKIRKNNEEKGKVKWKLLLKHFLLGFSGDILGTDGKEIAEKCLSATISHSFIKTPEVSREATIWNNMLMIEKFSLTTWSGIRDNIEPKIKKLCETKDLFLTIVKWFSKYFSSIKRKTFIMTRDFTNWFKPLSHSIWKNIKKEADWSGGNIDEFNNYVNHMFNKSISPVMRFIGHFKELLDKTMKSIDGIALSSFIICAQNIILKSRFPNKVIKFAVDIIMEHPIMWAKLGLAVACSWKIFYKDFMNLKAGLSGSKLTFKIAETIGKFIGSIISHAANPII